MVKAGRSRDRPVLFCVFARPPLRRSPSIMEKSTSPPYMTPLRIEPIYYRTFADGPIPKTPWGLAALFVRRRMLGGMWLASAMFNRLHQFADMPFSPPLRYMIQAYLFSYLLEHSPRYFQENFAGKLAQKIKQAGQAAIQILGIIMHDAVRIATILAIGVTLLITANPIYAVILVGWTAVYLGVSAKLSKRTLALSKALSNEISTSTGRLVDAISNVELIRAFSRAAFERDLFSIFIQREANASRRIRRFMMISHTFQYTTTLGFQVLLIGIAVGQAVKGGMTAGDSGMGSSLSTLSATQAWSLCHRMLEVFEQYGVIIDSIELVTRPHEIVDRQAAPDLKVPRGEIEFRQVHFA